MGKKRVAKQKIEETNREIDESRPIKKKSEGDTPADGQIAETSKKIVSRFGRIYISSTYNNVRTTATDGQGNVIAWSTSGYLRFKGPKKATPFAASQVTENLLQKIFKSGVSSFDVFIKGVGGGRESALRTLISKNVNIASIKDITPLRHGGCRPKKARRI